ncbi:MAG: hypothetical protein J4G09_12385, partial [Proteobacteria bacterium]|nr:hypothetical protein [Pseudomonadota bacterium]
KCHDVGALSASDPNLFRRFRRTLKERDSDLHDKVLFDADARVALYKWYDFESASALNKILVKREPNLVEPEDIASVSQIVPNFRDAEKIQRVYAADSEQIDKLREILEEVQQ